MIKASCASQAGIPLPRCLNEDGPHTQLHEATRVGVTRAYNRRITSPHPHRGETLALTGYLCWIAVADQATTVALVRRAGNADR